MARLVRSIGGMPDDAPESDPYLEARREVARRFFGASLVVKVDEGQKPWFHIGLVRNPLDIGQSLVKSFGCGRSPEEAIRDAELHFRQRAAAKDRRDAPPFDRFEDWVAAKKRHQSRSAGVVRQGARRGVARPDPGLPQHATSASAAADAMGRPEERAEERSGPRAALEF